MLTAFDPFDVSRLAFEAERNGRYAEAITLYTQILEHAPHSAAARSASARRDELAPYAAEGFTAYTRYQRVLREYPRLGSQAAMEEAEAILQAHPTSRVIPEVLFWIASEYLEVRKDSETASKGYRKVVDRFPDHPLAITALDRIGKILESRGRFAEAEAVYREMAVRYPTATRRESLVERQAELARLLLRQRLAWMASGILFVAVIVFIAVGGLRTDVKTAWRFWKPKAGFVLLLSIAPAAFLAWYDDQWSWSLTWLGIAFAVYSLALAALGARRQVPPQRMAILVEATLFKVLAPLAIVYLVVHRFGLWEAFGL